MKLLAFDTSTEMMSLAVQHGADIFEHTGVGGAQASLGLIGAIESLMAQAGLSYAQLDAIVFGRGPGSFTGLRTACSVVQGLAFGAQVKTLPVDTLLAVAQEARLQNPQVQHVLAALDARMGQVYAAYYDFNSIRSSISASNPDKTASISLLEPAQLPQLTAHLPADCWLVGNLRPALEAVLPPEILAMPHLPCLPTARALLSLAPQLIEAGLAVDAEHALPLYIRDKVALTTSEREAKIVAP